MMMPIELYTVQVVSTPIAWGHPIQQVNFKVSDYWISLFLVEIK